MEKSAQEVVLTVSSSPHVRCNESIPKIMSKEVISRGNKLASNRTSPIKISHTR